MKTKTPKLYYIQSGFSGNAILWWAENANGYTTDINEAGKFTEKFAKQVINNKDRQDIAWECSYIDSNNIIHRTVINQQTMDEYYCLRDKKRRKNPFTKTSWYAEHFERSEDKRLGPINQPKSYA